MSKQESASKLISTITIAGAIAGLLMAVLFVWANPRIQAHANTEMMSALDEVLAKPAKIETYLIYRNRLVKQAPAGIDTVGMPRVFAGYREDGTLIGFGMTSTEPGFSELLTIAFGYDPNAKVITGMKVLDSKETPGIADEIITPGFAKRFEKRAVPIKGIKVGRSTGDAHEVDMISGATISSRALISAINHQMARVQPAIDAFMAETEHK